MELVNRETNFNKIFNTNQNVGVMDPFQYKVFISKINQVYDFKKEVSYKKYRIVLRVLNNHFFSILPLGV